MNSTEWRRRNPDKYRESSKKWNEINKVKYKNDPTFREKSLNNFARYYKRKYASDPIFREKQKDRVRLWRKLNPEKYKIRSKIDGKKSGIYAKKLNITYRERIIKHYTNGKNNCMCCGYEDNRFLTIDHIIPISKTKTKREGSLRKFIISNNFPDGFQILCWNCNMGKGTKDRCPHKDT